MRILIFHGYLLEGTGSNVYNARLARALVALGHEVHLLCQDRHPERQPFVDAVGEWEGGLLRVRPLDRQGIGPQRSSGSRQGSGPQRSSGSQQGSDPQRSSGSQKGFDPRWTRSGGPARCTVYRPDIGDLLPVYVEDRYEGIEARTFARCDDAEIARYLDANVAAVRELAERVRPDVALANHLIMGPAILARGLAASGTPYAVKVHGSALEYTVKPIPERFLGFAREGLGPAAAILVGSSHTAQSLWGALGGGPTIAERTRLGPPGVDVERFQPRSEREAAAAVRALAARLRADPTGSIEDEGAFARDDLAAAAALERVEPGRDRLVGFVGKLIVNKGVDLLLAAWPLVLQRVPRAKLVIVGFGSDRALLERLLEALAAGDLERAQAGALPHLLAFLRGLSGEPRRRYLAAARALPERAVFAGRLDHEELAELLPACEALVVPSTFPEAFGMVAAEGAACGAFPISAAHSGLREVSAVLARAVPAQAAEWLSFALGDRAVAALAERLVDWLEADPRLRELTRAGLAAAVREHWSWEGVARGVIAAAQGKLDALERPLGSIPSAR